MYRDPGKIGLIILGASEYDHVPEHGCKAFKKAREAVKSYFLDCELGLGLSDRTIFDGFDMDAEKHEVLFRLYKFVENTRIDDLFIYISSHGTFDNDRLKICLKKSRNMDNNDMDTFVDNGDWESYIDFENLVERIRMKTSSKRIFCIVDCCSSGLVHKRKFSCEQFSEYHYLKNEEIRETDDVCGIAIITANSEETPGTVVASDDLPGIEFPLFTHVLLQLLKEGVQKIYGDGFAFEHIYALALDRIPKLIDEINDGNDEAGPIVSDMQRKSCVPGLSDRMDDSIDNPQVILPSRVCVFPNNHQQHHAKAASARKARERFRVQEELSETVADLDKKNKALEVENRELKNRINDELGRSSEMAKVISSLEFEKETIDRLTTAQSERLMEMKKDIGNLTEGISDLTVENEKMKTEVSEGMSVNERLRKRSQIYRRVAIVVSGIASMLALSVVLQYYDLMPIL